MTLNDKIKPYIIVFTIIVSAQCSVGQTQFSITPYLGGSLPFSSTHQSSDKDFKRNIFSPNPSVGLFLDAGLNGKWTISYGVFVSSNTGIGFRYGSASRDLFEGGFSTASTTIRSPLKVQLPIGTYKWLRSKRRLKILSNTTQPVGDDILYLILFRLRGFGGLSYNYITHQTGEGETEKFSRGTIRYDVLQRYSLSVLAGINLQFFNYNKDRFQLSITYNQGLNTLVSSDITYNLGNQSYVAQVKSRGSYLSVELGYPIKLNKPKKKSV
jgi:hypothetical protein